MAQGEWKREIQTSAIEVFLVSVKWMYLRLCVYIKQTRPQKPRGMGAVRSRR
jgi:hypothetical protein